jgi:hypothetical protein
MLLDNSSGDVRLQLAKTNFLGKDGFTWWVGQVALLKSSTGDMVQLQANESGKPLYYDRVKVRIIGYHTANCDELPDEDLPWAHIMIPPGQSNGSLGNGRSHEYKGGETVIGFFIDGDDGQQPVILGALYKNAGVPEETNSEDILKKKCASFKAFEPQRIKNPQLQNTRKRLEGGGGGKNGATGVSSKKGESKKATPGLETTVQGVKDISRAAESFAQKSDDTTTPVTKCEQDSISRVTKVIDDVMRQLSYVQELNGKFVNTITGSLVNIQAKIKQGATTISGAITGLIKTGMRKLFDKIVELVNPKISRLFAKTDQAKAGNEVRNLISTLYCIFKNVIKTIIDLVLDALNSLIEKAVGATSCNVNSFLGKILNPIFKTLDELTKPIITALNFYMIEPINSIIPILQKAMGISRIVKSLVNCDDTSCEKATEKFSMKSGPSIGPVDSFGGIFSGSTCNPAVVNCGPPKVEFLGGGGVGAAGNAIINKTGQLIGIDITSAGIGYAEPPVVSVTDPCNKGSGAVIAKPIMRNGSVAAVPIFNGGTGYLNTQTQQFKGEEPQAIPSEKLSENVLPVIERIEIINGGTGYTDNDTVTTDPNGGEWEVVTGPGGTVTDILPIEPRDPFSPISPIDPILPTPTNPNPVIPPTPTNPVGVSTNRSKAPKPILDGQVPEVIINSETGVGAVLVPVLKFVKVDPTKEPTIDTRRLIQVVDCVQR